MLDTPMIYSGPMVRALLRGHKTMTRRLPHDRRGRPSPWLRMHQRFKAAGPGYRELVWVKETWQAGMAGDGPCVAYRANSDRWYPDFTGADEGAGPSFDYGAHPAEAWKHGFWIPDVEARGPWSTPMHTPRWASRLSLTVTATKLERLQDISSDDAKAEGMSFAGRPMARNAILWGYDSVDTPSEQKAGSPEEAFRLLWLDLHGATAWLENPEVVALTFTVDKRNIDKMGEETGTPTDDEAKSGENRPHS